MEKHLFKSSLLICMVGVMGWSCGDDDVQTLNDVSENVEPEISPFIETFVQQAAERGFTYDFTGFEAVFSDEDIDENEDICGQASPFSDSRNFITIRRNELCWIGQPSTHKEALVFHELGHALLDRPHRDDRFANGLVKSTMESGMLGPYNEFSPLLTQYLFDELFDQTAPEPEWVNNKTEEVFIDINSGLEDSQEGWSFFSTQNLFKRTSVTGVRTDEAAAEGQFSLKLESIEEFDETLFWRFRTDDLTNLPETADIIIEVTLRLQNVQGGGVAIAGGIDKDGQLLQFKSSENDLTLTGTSVFETHTITVPYFPNTPAVVSIILAFLPNTTGLVFFDDIQIKGVYNPAFGPV